MNSRELQNLSKEELISLLIDKERENKHLDSMLNSMSDPVLLICNDFNVKIMNKEAQNSINPAAIADASSPKCYEVLCGKKEPCSVTNHPCPLSMVNKSKQRESIIHKKVTSNGAFEYIEFSANPLFDEDKNIIGIIESSHNITHHIESVEHLAKENQILDYKANHDTLTKVPNRYYFRSYLNNLIKQDEGFALLFVDIDDFKVINDVYGHDAGDAVLKEFTKRVKRTLRSADMLARLGGDEFTIILHNILTREVAIHLTTKILEALKKPLAVNNTQINMACSIGITLSRGENSYTTLLKKADLAMYQAKQLGKNRLSYYKESYEVS